jgi:hypothetical protein
LLARVQLSFGMGTACRKRAGDTGATLDVSVPGTQHLRRLPKGMPTSACPCETGRKIRHCCTATPLNGARRASRTSRRSRRRRPAAPAKGEEDTRDVSTIGWFFLNGHGARLLTVLIESRIHGLKPRSSSLAIFVQEQSPSTAHPMTPVNTGINAGAITEASAAEVSRRPAPTRKTNGAPHSAANSIPSSHAGAAKLSYFRPETAAK